MDKSEMRELMVALERVRDDAEDQVRELQDKIETLTTLIIGIQQRLDKMTDEVT